MENKKTSTNEMVDESRIQPLSDRLQALNFGINFKDGKRYCLNGWELKSNTAQGQIAFETADITIENVECKKLMIIFHWFY